MSKIIKSSKRPVITAAQPISGVSDTKTIGSIRSAGRGALAPAALSLASMMLASTALAQDAGDVLPTIDVVSNEEGGYQTNVPALTRVATPLRDTPQTVNVVPQQLIRQQNATNLTDALRNVAGITFRAGEGGNQGDTPLIRGFDARNDIFRDGVRDPGWYTRDTFAVDAVEVYKGPSSFLFGRGSTGGAINLVTKTPKDRPFVDGEVIGTSSKGVRATVDANGKVNDIWSARIQVMGQNYPFPGREDVVDRRWGIAPSISGKITEQTRVTFSHIYQHDDLIPDRGIPFLPATFGTPRLPAPVARDTFYGILNRSLPDSEKVDANVTTAKIEHDLSSTAKVTNTTRYVSVDRFNRATLTQAFAPPVGGLATYSYRPPRQQLQVENNLLANQTDFAARFNTGAVTHNVTAGLELAREDRKSTPFTYVANSSGATSVFDPDPYRAAGSFTGPGVDTTVKAHTVGAYAADQMKINEYLEFLAGVRFDNFQSSQTTPVALSRRDDIFSYRVGAVFHPVAWTSIYVMHGTSANPSAEFLTLAAANLNVGPEQNETTEVGAKADLLDGRLSLSGAAFYTEKTNARVADPSNGTVNILDGVTRVQGFEMAVSGYVTKEWQVYATYTYLDSRVERTSVPAQLNKRLIGTPENAFSLWSTYDITPKLTVGGGAYYVGEVFADVTNTALVPDYWRFDAMVSYKVTPNTTLQLNVYNLTDEYYYASSYVNWANPGPGRYASLSLRVKY